MEKSKSTERLTQLLLRGQDFVEQIENSRKSSANAPNCFDNEQISPEKFDDDEMDNSEVFDQVFEIEDT